MKDLEQTVRYRRKIEKDELYIHTMLQLLPVMIISDVCSPEIFTTDHTHKSILTRDIFVFKSMEHYILQNNACNIYEQYFTDMEVTSLIQRAFSRTVNVYRDPLIAKRRITHLSWSPDQGNRFAASYSNVDFKKSTSGNYTSYIWEVGTLSEWPPSKSNYRYRLSQIYLEKTMQKIRMVRT